MTVSDVSEGHQQGPMNLISRSREFFTLRQRKRRQGLPVDGRGTPQVNANRKPWFCRVSVNVYPRVSTLQTHYNGHSNGSIQGGIMQVFEVCRIHIPYFARSGTSIGHIGAFPQIWMFKDNALFWTSKPYPRSTKRITISYNIYQYHWGMNIINFSDILRYLKNVIHLC